MRGCKPAVAGKQRRARGKRQSIPPCQIERMPRAPMRWQVAPVNRLRPEPLIAGQSFNHRGKSMKQLISAAVAAIFAVVTFAAAAQAPAPSGAPAADAPKTEKKAKKQKKAKKSSSKSSAKKDKAPADAPK